MNVTLSRGAKCLRGRKTLFVAQRSLSPEDKDSGRTVWVEAVCGGIHEVVSGEGPGRRSTKRRTDAWPVLLGKSRTCWRPMCGRLGEPPPERDHEPSHALKWYKMMGAAELLPETSRDGKGGHRDE